MQLFFGAASMGADLQSAGGVAYFAHIGGFIAGMALIVLLGGRTPPPRRVNYDYWPRR
jgi:membrane associated rhomboid family serine protease